MVQDHMDGEDEKSYLHKPLFNVNMRLFSDNKKYNKFVHSVITYMKSLFRVEYSDYDKLKGLSGANIGIPFNIVVVLNDNDKFITMINPTVIDYDGDVKMRKSNCGSLRLSKPISVARFTEVVVQYYTEKGESKIDRFEGTIASTIDHEIDHNNGITIEDRQAEKVA